MVILLSGASHSGKTVAAQFLLKMLHYQTISQDLIKMGLIRSGSTSLIPEDDESLMDYLWPITREMVKTAIENRQDLIIEGCYIPFTWQSDFTSEYLKDIRFLCLALSESYINKHFGLIKDKANVIENRRSDDLDKTQLIEENRYNISECSKHSLPLICIINDWKSEVSSGLSHFLSQWKTQSAHTVT